MKKMIVMPLSALIVVGFMTLMKHKDEQMMITSKLYADNDIFEKWRPRVQELDATKCPCYKTYIIRNEKKRKVYGPYYAHRENKELKRA